MTFSWMDKFGHTKLLLFFLSFMTNIDDCELMKLKSNDGQFTILFTH